MLHFSYPISLTKPKFLPFIYDCLARIISWIGYLLFDSITNAIVGNTLLNSASNTFCVHLIGSSKIISIHVNNIIIITQ